MRGKIPRQLAVGAAALALFAAGCGGTDDAGTTTGKTGGELRVNSGEPESLLPANTNESEGSAILRAVYQGLVDYDPESGKPVNAIADSIESTDSKKWTIKIKSGYKFENGEPVNADAFIRSWNFAAYGPNGAGNSYFFDRIDGYADLQSKDPDGEEGPQKAPEPKAKEMTGLKKIDDNTIEVNLSEPFASFPAVLGYTAFVPMAKACADDAKGCNEKPIGNGQFKMDGAWQHKVQVKVVRNDDYAGTKAKLDKITFKIYDNQDTAYADFQAGELDLIDTLPPAKYSEAKAQYADKIIEQPSSNFTYVGFPLYNANFKDKRIRQALSLSIDRQAIIDAVFSGRFTPAKSLVTPLIPGSRDSACAYCTKDVEKAKSLLAEAGGWKGGKLQLWFNAGANHDQWMQAVGDQIKQALGIDYELKGSLQFAEYLGQADAKKFTGPFRLGWIMDYPVMENYLKPLHGSQGSSNNSTYSNPEADNLIKQGDGAKSVDEAITFYQKAEDLILEDMPVIPMWFGKTSVVKGSKLATITYNRVNELDWGTAAMA